MDNNHKFYLYSEKTRATCLAVSQWSLDPSRDLREPPKYMSDPENREQSGLVLMSDGAQAVSDVCLRTADVSWVLQKSLHLPLERGVCSATVWRKSLELSRLMRTGANGRKS